MRHLSRQVEYLEDQLRRVSSILNKALFIQESESPPRPGVNLWLILDGGIVTTGYYLNREYVADSGAVVHPTHWCMIPPTVKREVDDARKVLKVRKKKPGI